MQKTELLSGNELPAKIELTVENELAHWIELRGVMVPIELRRSNKLLLRIERSTRNELL